MYNVCPAAGESRVRTHAWFSTVQQSPSGFRIQLPGGNGEGKREKGEGKMEKGKGRREKGEGREGRREKRVERHVHNTCTRRATTFTNVQKRAETVTEMCQKCEIN